MLFIVFILIALLVILSTPTCHQLPDNVPNHDRQLPDIGVGADEFSENVSKALYGNKEGE